MPQVQSAKPVGAPVVPKKRRTNGVANWNELDNRDPDMHYVQVDRSPKPMYGVDFYKSMGYEVVVKKKDGCEMRNGSSGRQIGEEVVANGLVLMQIPKTELAEIEAEGNESCDRLEAMLRDRKRSISDVQRGQRMVTDGGEEAFRLLEDKE